MPEKSGVGFYREIREDPELREIPIVVVTGVAGLTGKPEDLHKFLSTRKQLSPFDSSISKSIDQGKLLRTVKNLLK